MKQLLPYLKALYGGVATFVSLVVQAYATSATHTITSQAWWVAALGGISAAGVIWGVPNIPSKP